MLLLTFFISIASSIPIETTPTFSEIQATSLNINYPISLPKISLETGGSFLVVGDFGYQSLTDYWYSQKTNQQKVAEAMISLSKIHKPNFVISVGDNFYRGGQYQYTDGVIDVKDGRFNDFWKNVYIKGNLSNVPWFVVLGNHDWVGNIEAQVEYSTHSKMWNMPDLFYETNFKVPSSLCKDPKCNPNANFIFIDTNFLTYGYFSDLEYTATMMMPSFYKQGWVNETVGDLQLKWIEDKLIKSANNAFTFVIGHHPLGNCKPYRRMSELDSLLIKYNVSGYIHGHAHYMAHSIKKSTIYLLAGASGQDLQAQKCHDDDGAVKEVQLHNSHGFMRGIITNKSFTAEFYSDIGSRVYSTGNIEPRVF